MDAWGYVLSGSLRFFFLLTPFFVLSMFLSMTSTYEDGERRKLAWKIAFAAWIVCLILLFFGRWLFTIFGITVDAFRIGGGALLFLSAVTLVNGAAAEPVKHAQGLNDSDISVVPLAIPVTVGPATTGALLIVGAEAATVNDILLTSFSLTIALAAVGLILYASTFLERVLKRRGIVILSKLTGLILAAIASEMIFTGIRAFLVVSPK